MRKILIVISLLTMSACTAQQNGSTGNPVTSAATAVGDAFSKLNPNKPRVKSEEVLGKGEAWLRTHLGEPSFIRADLQARIWQYKNKNCVLNLFLYTEPSSQPALAVLHFDARDSQGLDTNRDDCLATF